MGSGKTTAGKSVARRLGTSFEDSDLVFTERFGPIPDFFASHGEAAFRRHEHQIIAERLALGGVCDVIALGGGAVASPETRKVLKSHIVVFLQVSLQSAITRVGSDPNRPVMRSPDLYERFAQRQEWYREVATFSIQVDRISSGKAARLVVQELRQIAGLDTAPDGDDLSP